MNSKNRIHYTLFYLLKKYGFYGAVCILLLFNVTLAIDSFDDQSNIESKQNDEYD